MRGSPCWDSGCADAEPENGGFTERQTAGQHCIHYGKNTTKLYFKLRQTAGVKRLIERLWRRGDWQKTAQSLALPPPCLPVQT